MNVTTEKLRKATPVVKIRALCLLAGLSPTTINSKLMQGREVSDAEAHAIESVARAHGVTFIQKNP
jgi:DNA-binding transcriptional regulator YdaS (Cro superfamily)